MKEIHCLYLAVAMLALKASGDVKGEEWGPTTNYAQMSISLKGGGNKIQVGEPVKLVIRFKNSSTNKAVRVYRANSLEHDPGYSFAVISPTGRDITCLTAPFSESGSSITVGPKQACDVEFELSELCKFTEIGTFQITARKAIWSPENKRTFQVTSNPLFVSVVRRNESIDHPQNR